MTSTIDLTLGALEVGTLLSVALYGLITLQVYIYFQGVHYDHLLIRTLVAFIWILDTIHSFFICVYLYHETITNYGRPESLKKIHWTFGAILLPNGALTFSTQSFFAYRIRVLSGRLAMGIIAWTVCVARISTTLMLVILTANTKDFDSYIQRYWWTIPVTASVQAFGDTLNTTALCFFLAIRRTRHRGTNHLITKIIQWTIETCLVTTICAIATIILCVTMPTSFIWVGLYFFFPKIYSISMLFSLNNRRKLRKEACEKSKEERLALSMQLSLSGPQESPSIEMAPMRSGDGWDGLGQKPASWE